MGGLARHRPRIDEADPSAQIQQGADMPFPCLNNLREMGPLHLLRNATNVQVIATSIPP